MPERIFLGVGTGENLNEHILGDRWPAPDERLEMLEEAVELMRELWKGEKTTFRGKHYTVEGARIYTVPDEPPKIAAQPTLSRTPNAQSPPATVHAEPEDILPTFPSPTLGMFP